MEGNGNFRGLGIDMLTHTNFKKWKSCLESYLLGEDIWEVVGGDAQEEVLPTGTNDREVRAWKKMNAKAEFTLKRTVSPDLFDHIIGCKSTMFLLEYDYVPKISDFGLDWLMDPVDNHFSTFINGDFGDHGYVAPEYACTLRFTPAVDVYSFGVVLLELITGERPTHVSVAPERFKDSLVKWIAYLSSSS